LSHIIHGICNDDYKIIRHVHIDFINKSTLLLLTKYDVGAKANPPRNPRREPKNGMHIPIIIVNAETMHRAK
jgi:hypothetical protein